MKKSILTLALFIFATMSTAVYAASQSDGDNSDNQASDTSGHEDIDWEGSNSGNQHDGVNGDGNGRPPKHCTQDNENGTKHSEDCSGSPVPPPGDTPGKCKGKGNNASPC